MQKIMYSTRVKEAVENLVRVHFNSADRSSGSQSAPVFDVRRFLDTANSAFDRTRPIYVALECFRCVGTSTPTPFAFIWNEMPMHPNVISCKSTFMNQMLGYFNATLAGNGQSNMITSNTLAVPYQFAQLVNSTTWSFQYCTTAGVAVTDSQIGPHFFTIVFWQKASDKHEPSTH